MGLIFFLSAQPGLSTELGLIDLIGRKLAHLGTYAALTLLWWWALAPAPGRGPVGTVDPAGRRGAAALAAAVAISFLYAISDEYHQSHVEDRSGSPVDVGIDAVGIALAVWLVRSGRLPALIDRARAAAGRLRAAAGRRR